MQVYKPNVVPIQNYEMRINKAQSKSTKVIENFNQPNKTERGKYIMGKFVNN